MKWITLFLISCRFFCLEAQNYTFSKSTGTYTNLTGTTILNNANWSSLEHGVKIPFTFKYWGKDYTDSVYTDDFGSISLDDNFNEEISFFNEDLESRGFGKSPVSYVVTGTIPNRIFKLEFRNTGFERDGSLTDSAHVQCWIYETTNVIEFRYGPNSVKSTSWTKNGVFVGIIRKGLSDFIILENNPADPTVNKTDILNASTLNGMPANGTIYKFTPGNGSGIGKTIFRINIIQNRIYLQDAVQVKTISLYNVNGQLIQAASNAGDINLSDLGHGLYLVVVESNEGVITQKIIL